MLDLHRLQALRVEAELAQDRRRDLLGRDLGVDCPTLDRRVSRQQHDIRVVSAEATVLGNLFSACGVDGAESRLQDNVRRPGISERILEQF